MTETRIFLVAYADTEGPYAVAFSTREDADAFVASFSAWRRDDFTIIDTTIDQARVVARKQQATGPSGARIVFRNGGWRRR